MSEPLFDPAEKAALDRFAVPSLPGDFATRVVVASADRAAPAPWPWQARGSRPAWRRRTGIVTGGVALGLLSAAAAATGYLGEPVRKAVHEAPVIGPIIAQVAPPPKLVVPKPKTVRAPKRAAQAEPLRQAEAPPPTRGEAVARRLVERFDARQKLRAELGLPPGRVMRRREVVNELLQLPPEERIEVVQRLREIRRERIGEFWRMRQERRQRWRERRLAEESGGAEPALEETPVEPLR